MDDNNQMNELRKHILEYSLDQGMTRIVVAPNTLGVILPSEYMGQPQIILHLSRKFSKPTQLTKMGVFTELRFKGEYKIVALPWNSIKAIVEPNEKVHLFNDQGEPNTLEQTAQAVMESSETPGLERIEGGGQATPPRTGHLKLVS